MTLPSALFGFLLASLYAALYHLVRDGGPRRLFAFLLSSWGGFLAGVLLGAWQGWSLLRVGPLDLGLASLGSLVLLVAGDLVHHTRTHGIGLFPDE